MFRAEIDDFPEDFNDPHEDFANRIQSQDENEDFEDMEEHHPESLHEQQRDSPVIMKKPGPTILSNDSVEQQSNAVPESNVNNSQETQNNVQDHQNPDQNDENAIQIPITTEQITIEKPHPSPHDVFPTKDFGRKPSKTELKTKNKGAAQLSKETQSQVKKKRDDIGLVTFVRQVHENQGDFDKEINDIHETVPDYLVKQMKQNIATLPKTSFSLDKNLIVNADSKQALTYSQFISHIQTFKQAKEPITRFLMHGEDDSISHVVAESNSLSSIASVASIGSYENLLKLQKSDTTSSLASITSSTSQDTLHKRKVRKVIGLHIPSFINIASLALGLSACGFKVALLNPLYSVKRLRRIIQFSHVSSIFTTSELLPQLSRVFENKSKKTDVKKVVVFDSQYSLIDSLIRQVDVEKKNPTPKQKDLPELDQVKQVPENDENSNDEVDFVEDDIDEEENINRKQMMIIQEELDQMKEEHSKWMLPDDIMLVPAVSFFRLTCVNVKGPQENTDIEYQKKKANEIAFIFFSGGKFIGLTHKNLIASLIQEKYQFSKNMIQKDRIKACLGLHHFSAFTFRFLLLETAVELSSVVAFDLVAFVDKRSAKQKEQDPNPIKIDYQIQLKSIDIGQTFRIFDYWEVNFLYTQPNLIVDITENVEIATLKLGRHLRDVVTTSDVLTKQHIVQFKRKFQKNGNKHLAMGQMFGCSEACGAITYQTAEEANKFPTLAGSLLPGIDMRIIKQDKQGFGEFIFKGPNTFFLYNSEEQNNSRTIDLEGEKFLWTGDKGKVMDTQLFITFRVKEVVKHGGWTINELEIEKILKKHPLIEDACVMAERTEKGLEITTAHIVKKKASKLKKKMTELSSIPAEKFMNLASDQMPGDGLNDEEQDFMEKEFDEEAKVDFDVDNFGDDVNLLKTQKTKLTEKDVLHYLENHNAWNAFDKIHKIHFLKKLPKDSSGKTNKYKLIVKPKELKGSFISAVFSLVSSNFGVGTLGLVYAIVQSGFAVGMLELFFFALMGILVCKIAADAAVKVRKFTFQEVLLVVLGRWAAFFYQITYSLGGFGACITYFIVLSNSFMPMIGQLMDIFPFLRTMGLALFQQKPIFVLFLGVFILFPFTLFRDVSFLSLPASLSVFGVFYFVAFAVGMAIYQTMNGEIQFLTMGETPKNGIGNYYIFNFSVNALGIPTFLISPPMISGAFTAPPYILAIIGNLKDRSKSRINFLLFLTFAIVSVVYTALCISGALSFGSTAKDDLLTNYSKTNIFATVGRITYSFVVVFSFVLVFFVTRSNLKSLLFPKYSDDSYPLWMFVVLTFIPFLIILFGGMILDSVSLLLSFIGSVNGSTQFFIMPGLLAWKIYRSWMGKVVSIVLVLMGLFMMTGGLASSVSNLIIFIMTITKGSA